MECDGMKWKKMKRVRIRNTGATPPPLPPPLAPAQATPSPSYHSFGARQPPHCTRPYAPRGYTRATAAAHRTWYPPSKKCKSFVPFTSNFPLAHTPRRLTNLAPQGHLDKFFFFFLLFPSFLELVQDNGAHNITAVSSPRARDGRPHPLTPTSLAARKRICHHTALSPTQLTNPVMPNLGFVATPTTSPPPRHSRPSPPQPAPPRSRHHATLCGHASHSVAPTLTRVAGTHWPCRPPTKMCFLSFFSFFPFIKLFQDNSYHINVTPISLARTQAAPSPSQPRRPAATTVAA